ncbi:MAG: globin domain-containing protein [Chitinophagales bacterium]
MNTTQKQIVKTSFIRVFPVAQQITGLFFANLLAQDPTLEPIAHPYLHEEDSLQKALMTAKVAVDNIAIVQPALENTAQKWAAQGLDAAHYDVAYMALEETLIHTLGEVSEEEKRAWQTAYDEITTVMKQAGMMSRSLSMETESIERSFPLSETINTTTETEPTTFTVVASADNIANHINDARHQPSGTNQVAKSNVLG